LAADLIKGSNLLGEVLVVLLEHRVQIADIQVQVVV
jgi:hypothetical protein